MPQAAIRGDRCLEYAIRVCRGKRLLFYSVIDLSIGLLRDCRSAA